MSVFERIRPRVEEIFDYLHRNPEISWEEYGTRDYLIPILEDLGCRVRRFEDHAGLVADYGDGPPTVAVRGDMDALWQEVDGSFRANHSCGHDAHMTVALGTLLYLREQKFTGNLRLLFQPAEEKGTGALKLMESHVLGGITHLYGTHLRPIQELRNGRAAPAILHGACSSIVGRIKGEDAHAGRPHLAHNAIEVGAVLVHRLQGIHLDPMIPHSMKLTQFQAGGSATNIIPGSAQFSIDLRAQTNEAMQALLERTFAVIKDTAQSFEVDIEFGQRMGTAASEVHPEARDLMARAIREVIGAEGYHEPIVTGGGDDFHFYTIKQSQLKATMLALGCDLSPGLHHPKMTFEREALFTGIQIMARAIGLTLGST